MDICPKVGHVVRPSKDLRKAYAGIDDLVMGDADSAVGIVLECIGISCKVYWQTGVTGVLHRTGLEVVSDG